MKNEICNTCIFLGTPLEHEPCKYCIDVYHGNSTAVKHTRSQYRNAAPTREELLARLEKLQGEYDALLDCYAQWEEPNEKGEFFVDFGKVLVEHEAQLTTANAEIESMHRELAAARQQAADRQAIIEVQRREIDEAYRKLSLAMNLWEDVRKERGEARELARRFYSATLESRAVCTELADKVNVQDIAIVLREQEIERLEGQIIGARKYWSDGEF